MFERIGQGASDMSGAGSSAPEWVLAVVAAFMVVAFVLAAARDRFDRPGRLVTQIAVVLVLAMVGLSALNGIVRRDVAAERRALEERAFELASRAFMPGSPLACLDPIVGARVEDGCEKSLFATPEATAAAVGYVAAQLSLLASARDNGAPGHGNALASCADPSRPTASASWPMCLPFAIAVRRTDVLLLPTCREPVGSAQISQSARSTLISKNIRPIGRLLPAPKWPTNLPTPRRAIRPLDRPPWQRQRFPIISTSHHRPRSRRSTS